MDKNTQLDRLGLFDARVPRYTSYPTAARFGTEITADIHSNWISSIQAGSSISLYMHFPFCRRLCWFCACRTQGVSSLSPVEHYVDVIIHELELAARSLPSPVRLSHLHWGGGTPTLLSPALMDRLSNELRKIFIFDQDLDFSVEIDPTELDQERCNMLKKIGMTRASVGIQDFNIGIQRIIGRDQSYDQTQAAIEMLRDAGITSVNADIVFGLPDQTPKRLSDTVQKLLSLSPDRVALYGYAHVPWMAKRQALIPKEKLPTPVERLKLFETAQDMFLWDGYDAIGIDHFARPDDSMTKAAKAGKLRRNFQGYTTDTSDVLLGLGASSISRFPQGFSQNIASTSHYSKSVLENQFATYRGHALTYQDSLRARLIEMVMCYFQIDLAAIRSEFDLARSSLNGVLAPIVDKYEGLITLTQDFMIISENARPLARMIAREFDTYDVAPENHSHAI